VIALPDPPAESLGVRFFEWSAQRPIIRVCRASDQPNTFNPTAAPGRVRPIDTAVAGQPVPTMYGANRADGALGESVFHDVPTNAPWTIPRAALYGRLRAVLIPQRPLRLVDLTGWAHKTLRIDGRRLVDCDPAEYAITARWAQRFHAQERAADGLYWRSRQFDRSFAFMLFGDRVAETDLNPVYDETVALWQGEGLEEVRAAAELAEITIVS
jgi:hypothetical protein